MVHRYMRRSAYWSRIPEPTHLPRWLATGFVVGAIAVLVFHQGAIAMLNQMGLTDRAPFPMDPTAPFGIPRLWSLAFWGGAWGLAMAALLRHDERGPLITAAALYGATLPTVVAWFVVAPLEGEPLAAGLDFIAMAVAVLANGAWGLATGAGLNLFGRSHVGERSAFA